MLFAGLPAARRSSGDSTPWSTALRTRCTSGSARSSIIVLSTSVSSPISASSTSLPSWRARSRAMRGYFWNKRPIGCIRVFITEFCRSETSRSSWLTAWSSACSVSESLRPARMSARKLVRRFLVRPISPERLSTWSRRAVSTRIVDSRAAAFSSLRRPAEVARTRRRRRLIAVAPTFGREMRRHRMLPPARAAVVAAAPLPCRCGGYRCRRVAAGQSHRATSCQSGSSRRHFPA